MVQRQQFMNNFVLLCVTNDGVCIKSDRARFVFIFILLSRLFLFSRFRRRLCSHLLFRERRSEPTLEGSMLSTKLTKLDTELLTFAFFDILNFVTTSLHLRSFPCALNYTHKFAGIEYRTGLNEPSKRLLQECFL
jgi:hypothetical protein